MSDGYYGLGIVLGAIMAGVGLALYVYDIADTATSLVLTVCGTLAVILAYAGQWQANRKNREKK
jgi:hypothetical protein